MSERRRSTILGLARPFLAGFVGAPPSWSRRKKQQKTIEKQEKAINKQQKAAARQAVETEHLRDQLDRLALHARIPPVMAWVKHAVVPEDRSVSVIMPTKNRSTILPRAIGSVLAQTYSRWELLVVDDGSHDGTTDYLCSLDDSRVVPLSIQSSGPAAARNHGLDTATGEFVVYLDDDNTMHEDWLKAVVWAFERRPELNTLYGASIFERWTGSRPDDLPTILFERYERERLRENNYIDMGMFAHRRTLPDARFNEELWGIADWDLIWRLARSDPPLALPVIANMYGVDAPDRLSQSPHHGYGPNGWYVPPLD